jgi:hypothetical protein
MSMQRLVILQERGLDPVAVMLSEFPDWGIVSFRAGLIREFQKTIAADANDEDGSAHAIIQDLTGGEKKRLARACECFVTPAALLPPSS